MPRKSYKPEEIVAKLRQVEVLTSQQLFDAISHTRVYWPTLIALATGMRRHL